MSTPNNAKPPVWLFTCLVIAILAVGYATYLARPDTTVERLTGIPVTIEEIDGPDMFTTSKRHCYGHRVVFSDRVVVSTVTAVELKKEHSAVGGISEEDRKTSAAFAKICKVYKDANEPITIIARRATNRSGYELHSYKMPVYVVLYLEIEGRRLSFHQ